MQFHIHCYPALQYYLLAPLAQAPITINTVLLPACSYAGRPLTKVGAPVKKQCHPASRDREHNWIYTSSTAAPYKLKYPLHPMHQCLHWEMMKRFHFLHINFTAKQRYKYSSFACATYKYKYYYSLPNNTIFLELLLPTNTTIIKIHTSYNNLQI